MLLSFLRYFGVKVPLLFTCRRIQGENLITLCANIEAIVDF